MKLNLTFILLVACVSPYDTKAQSSLLKISTSTGAFAYTAAYQKNRVLLENVLENIAKKYGVSLLYTEKSIRNNFVDVLHEYPRNLDSLLAQVLAPSGLKAKRIQKNYYVVYNLKSGSIADSHNADSHNADSHNADLHSAPLDTLPKPQNQSSDIGQAAGIRGMVLGEDGLPLVGVTVRIKDFDIGTLTDAKGNFAIPTKNTGAVTLGFSLIGYASQLKTVVIGQQVKMTLKESSRALKEVVVVGYGDQSKRNVSTSISTVQGRSINELPVGTLGEALVGKIAGAQVSSGLGGTPGESPTIRIRGIGSLGAGSEPLYVVDGVPLESEANFASINPADVLSISVLKDAASAAIYGSRAANGVIIVTTKTGVEGKPKFSISYSTGVHSLSKKIALLNTKEYLEYEPKFFKDFKGKEATLLTDKALKAQLGSSDWQDAIFKSVKTTQFGLTASSGVKDSKYYLSLGYLDDPGILLGTAFQRYNFRFNFDTKLKKNVTLELSVAPALLVQDRRPNGGSYTASVDPDYAGRRIPSPIYSALLMPPVVPVVLKDGRFGQPNFLEGNGVIQNNIYSPVAELTGIKNHNTNFQFLGSSVLKWNVLTNLEYKVRLSGTMNTSRREVYVPGTVPTDDSPLASAQRLYPNAITASEENKRDVSWLEEQTLNYKAKIKDHRFNLLLVQSQQKFSSSGGDVFGRQNSYITSDITNPSASGFRDGNVAYDIFTFSSLTARLNYDFKQRYFLQASIRNDGSSKFGPGNRYGNFRSISASWRIIEEPFLRKIDALSELKLRGSYGETGNATIPSFSYQNFVTKSNYSFGATSYFGTIIGGYNNPNLRWEKNHAADVGLELGLFKDRVYLTVDAYRKITDDQILLKQLPGITGYALSYLKNAGSVENKGLEFELNTQNVSSRHFKWSTEVNLSFNRNKVLDLDGSDNLGFASATTGWDNVFLTKVGRPIGDMYGFKVEGVILNKSDSARYLLPQASGRASPGDLKISDTNGDGLIDEKDRTVIGNALPKVVYGITNRFSYRGFDASFLLQGQYGGSIIDANLRNGFGSPGVNVQKEFYNNIWVESDPDRPVRFPSPNSRASYTFINSLTSLAVYSASYLRLSNINIGYTFKPAQLKSLRIQGLRIYLTGQNLKTWSSYPGYNPEVSLNRNNVNRLGVDQGVYPTVRTFTFGLNLSF